MVDLITLAHLHQGRALPNTKTNVIEAGPNQKFREEKDWYYNIEKENEKSERCGPVTFSEVSQPHNIFSVHLICKKKRNGMNSNKNLAIFLVVSCFPAQRFVGEKTHYATNKMLGKWNGWMAGLATIAAIEMVSDSQRNTTIQ